MVKKFDHFRDKNVLLHVTLIFPSILNLNHMVEIQFFKKHSIRNTLKLKEAFDLCDIWQARNPNSASFFFRQINFGIIERRLDNLFISNNLQESVN